MIWKALADPTRRSILNKLKTAPRTTGELSAEFGHLSRFAIMKHLGVLEKAELIKTKREGKFRWNYINTKPIQSTYEQWVSNLIRLKAFTKPATDPMDQHLRATTISIDMPIRARRPVVWQALTRQIDRWWLPEFHAHPHTTSFQLDARLGGLMYEEAGDGGIVWANVIGVDAPHFIELKGHLTPAFGGPAISFLRFELEETGKSTILHFTDELFGKLEDKLQGQLSSRWKKLLEEGFKKFAES